MGLKHPRVEALDREMGILVEDSPTPALQVGGDSVKKLEQLYRLVELLFPGEIKANERCCLPAVERLLCELSGKR